MSELPFSHGDVTTLIGMIGDIKQDVQKIRELLQEDEDDGEEENSEADS